MDWYGKTLEPTEEGILVVTDMMPFFDKSLDVMNEVAREINLAVSLDWPVVFLELISFGGCWDDMLQPTHKELKDLARWHRHDTANKSHLADGWTPAVNTCLEKKWVPRRWRAVGVHTTLCVKKLAYGLSTTGVPVDVVMDACSDYQGTKAHDGTPVWSLYEDRPDNLFLV